MEKKKKVFVHGTEIQKEEEKKRSYTSLQSFLAIPNPPPQPRPLQQKNYVTVLSFSVNPKSKHTI